MIRLRLSCERQQPRQRQWKGQQHKRMRMARYSWPRTCAPIVPPHYVFLSPLLASFSFLFIFLFFFSDTKIRQTEGSNGAHTLGAGGRASGQRHAPRARAPPPPPPPRAPRTHAHAISPTGKAAVCACPNRARLSAPKAYNPDRSQMSTSGHGFGPRRRRKADSRAIASRGAEFAKSGRPSPAHVRAGLGTRAGGRGALLQTYAPVCTAHSPSGRTRRRCS